MRHLIGTALTILICSPTAAENRDEPQGWISIFDGKSLAGWKPNERPKNWVVEDGAIVAGRTMKEKMPRNEFLIHYEEFGDFDLRLKVKLIGEGGNAGVHFQCRQSTREEINTEVRRLE